MTPEEERLEQIKKWWKEYRWTILGGTALGIATIGGWTGWNEYTQTQQESASVLYQQVSVAVVEMTITMQETRLMNCSVIIRILLMQEKRCF